VRVLDRSGKCSKLLTVAYTVLYAKTTHFGLGSIEFADRESSDIDGRATSRQ